MKVRNIVLAAVLSSSVAVLFVLLYLFYPLVASLMGGARGGAGSGGIGAVAGGVSEVLMLVFLVLEPLLFLAILFFLNWRERHRG